MKFGSLANDEWLQLMGNQFSTCSDIETVILKGHLLLEYVLNGYIERNNLDINEGYQGFSFAQKLKMYEIFGTSSLIPELKMLNKLRNDIAHTFELNRQLVNKLIRDIHKKSDPLHKRARSLEYKLIMALQSLFLEVRHEMYLEQEAKGIINKGFLELVEKDLDERARSKKKRMQ